MSRSWNGFGIVAVKKEDWSSLDTSSVVLRESL